MAATEPRHETVAGGPALAIEGGTPAPHPDTWGDTDSGNTSNESGNTGNTGNTANTANESGNTANESANTANTANESGNTGNTANESGDPADTADVNSRATTATAGGSGHRRWPVPWDTIKAYVHLTKPRIIELLLVTTVPTMFLAAGGLPDLGLAAMTLIGGTLAAAGANTLNSYYDRDIDAVMHRTGSRPLVTGRISPQHALIFGLVLSALSALVLAVGTNLLAAALGVVAIALYVVGYTMVLKRRTTQNIVWGGAAGCMPVLIGWAAITGTLTWTPLVLFLIIFFWTPPHYWPLALRFKSDYAAAGVPMLPVSARPGQVAVRVIRYSWLMVLASLALIPVAGMTWFYSVAAVVLAGLFLFEAYSLLGRVRRGAEDLNPMRLFHGSITYLSLLFLAVAIDPFIG